jgi:hypothetical protein
VLLVKLPTLRREAGVQDIDGILFDVGVSSPQIDDGERGFSFRHNAPLDMRMDTTQGETAAEWLARAEIKEITEVIRNYGEERFAFQIAKKVVVARLEQPIVTTGQFASLVRSTVRTREPGQDPATRSFQALRIHINQELRQLEIALPQALEAAEAGWAPGGDFLPFAGRPHRQKLSCATNQPRMICRRVCRSVLISCPSPSCVWSGKHDQADCCRNCRESTCPQCRDAGG